MAKKVIVKRTDDLGGAGDATRVLFSIEGQEYAIDLNKRNRATFLRRMSVYTENAEKGSNRSRIKANSPSVRQWAKSKGYDIEERGRIPGFVMKAWQDSFRKG